MLDLLLALSVNGIDCSVLSHHLLLLASCSLSTFFVVVVLLHRMKEGKVHHHQKILKRSSIDRWAAPAREGHGFTGTRSNAIREQESRGQLVVPVVSL